MHVTSFKESINGGCKHLTGHITHDYFFCCSSCLRHGFRASLIAWASGLLSQARFSDSKTVTFFFWNEFFIFYFFETKDGHLLICSIWGKKYKRDSCVAVNNRETKWTWQNEWCQVIWTTYAATKISTACSVEILAALLQLTRPSRRRTHWTVQFR